MDSNPKKYIKEVLEDMERPEGKDIWNWKGLFNNLKGY